MNTSVTPANESDTLPFDLWFLGTLVVTFFRCMLGGWMVVNGLNHLLPMFGLPHIYPQPLGTLHLSNVMLVSFIEIGVMDIVKWTEFVLGLCLVFNRFVPLALAISLPISLMVYYNSIALNYRYERIFSFYMAVWCTYMNVILILAYIKHYIPLLKFRTSMGKPGDIKLLGTIFK